jgi:hypothetical protein
MKSEILAAVVALAAAAPALFAQTPPLALMTIDVENVVEYEADVPDVSKLALLHPRPPAFSSNNFYSVIWVADVVAVKRKPAKGTWSSGQSALPGAQSDTWSGRRRQQRRIFL